jgi:hypothetical protein
MRRIAVALIAAGLALVLVASVALLRDDGGRKNEPAPTLIALKFIPAGMPAKVVFDSRLDLVGYGQPNEPRVDERTIGDPSYLGDRVTTRDIQPGDQILVSYNWVAR